MLAAELLRNLLQEDADRFEANYMLGMLHHHMNQNNLAIPLLVRAVELNPGDFACVINLGIILREEGSLAQAQDMLEKAVVMRVEGQPDELVGALMLLCSPAGDWITGQVLHVDGGWVLRP